VQFFDGTTLLGTATVANGQAVFTTSALPSGSLDIVAKYSGDGTHQPAQASIGQVISPLASTVTLTDSAPSLALGQTGTFTAQVGPAPPKGFAAQTGQVLFQVDGSPVATVNLASGAASLSRSTLTLGTHSITAVYTGDSTWGVSHASVTVTVTPPALQLTNAATPLSSSFADDEIVSMFNVIGMNGNTGAVLPLGTSLGGVTITVKDSAGGQRAALLYGVFASTEQVNFVVPTGTAAGTATVSTTVPSGGSQSTQVTIGNIAPGIFTVNQNGQGTFAGQIVYVNADGSRTVVESATLSGGTYATTPINLSTASGPVFLQLYGTGVRHASTVTATINGTSVMPEYAGAQGTDLGLDQINLPLPNSLARAGTVNIVITADGQAANTVTALIQ
jgi:large repetitive protein